MRRRSPWMAAPYTASAPMTSLKPLNSGGLCEPVTCTPPSTLSTCVAKYSAGVGSSPTSTACPPTASMPDSTPCASEAPEGRLSRPTASRGARPSRSHASVATAWPTARATSAVSWSPTVPRISYSRKMTVGSGTGAFPASATGLRGRHGGGRRRQPVPTCLGQVEQAVGTHAEEQQSRNGDGHHSTTQPAEAHARVSRFGRLGLHVHRHNDGEIVARGHDAGKHEDRGEHQLSGARRR